MKFYMLLYVKTKLLAMDSNGKPEIYSDYSKAVHESHKFPCGVVDVYSFYVGDSCITKETKKAEE